jgi:hypothetical protein
MVFGLLQGGVASVTGIGRNLPGSAHVKHAIKRADRFLGNDSITFRGVAPFFVSLLPEEGPVLVCVDWTLHTGGVFQTLAAQVPVKGRCLPIHARTHVLKGIDQCAAEEEFLEDLAELFDDREVIIVSDRGFGSKFQKNILKHGWNFVTRLRSQTEISIEDKWLSTGKIRLTPGEVVDWGVVPVGKSKKMKIDQMRVVGYREHPKNRKESRTSSSSEKARKSAKAPWILMSSLDSCSPEKIIQIYGQRFQIEESFRDWKNGRFCGYRLNEVKCSQAGRLERLLVVIAAAYTIQVAHGLVAIALDWEPQFRVNRSKHRQIGAFILGGLMLLKRKICNYPTLLKHIRLAIENVLSALGAPLQQKGSLLT